MRKFIAALLLLVPATMFSGAQEKPDDEALKIAGVMDGIPVVDMIHLAAEYEKLSFLFNSKTVTGEFTLVAPRDGITVPRDRMFATLQDVLAQYRFCAVNHGGTWVIVPMVEVCTYAPIVTEAELSALDESAWVTVMAPLENADANAVTGALRNLTSRQGGVIQPVQGANTVLICDRCDRVREIMKLVRQADESARLSTRRHALPAGADADKYAQSVFELMPTQFSRSCMVTAAPGGNALLVTGVEAIHSEIPLAIEALK
ncbi:MAG: hypothetical protein IPK87_02375 [Planctomycetes bacterium]|nr:hypothetical protein [Planctomycetota bacterium]